jgi:hypothetical protein
VTAITWPMPFARAGGCFSKAAARIEDDSAATTRFPWPAVRRTLRGIIIARVAAALTTAALVLSASKTAGLLRPAGSLIRGLGRPSAR